MTSSIRTRATFRPARIALAAALAAGGMWISFGAQAATALSAAERSEVQATYRSDRAACLNGNTWQDRDTCLREAFAARRSALRGEFASLPATEYQANAMQRCDALPPDARSDCNLRMGSDGVVIGSVASGAIVRELPAAVVAARSAPAETPTTIAMAAPAAEATSSTAAAAAAEPTTVAAADSSSLAPMDSAAATEATATASTTPSAEADTTATVDSSTMATATAEDSNAQAAVTITPPLSESLTADEVVVEPAQHPALEPATAVEATSETSAIEPARPSEEATVDALGIVTPGLLNGPR